MRYWHPFTEDVLNQMQMDRINTLVIVPLYPQFSISTSGSSLRLLQDIFYRAPSLWGPDKVAHTVVPAWYHRSGYIKVMARLILDQIADYSPEEMQQGIHVLYSAHGVPQSYIEAGDPYQRQIEECIDLISRQVCQQLRQDATRPRRLSKQVAWSLSGEAPSPADMEADRISRASCMCEQGDSPPSTEVARALQFHLSFQSRVGPVKWLTPYTEEMLVKLGEVDQVKNLVVVPVSFVSEHIETLEEIDMEYQELAKEHGVVNWKRVPALNTDAAFIEDLADLVIEALESPTLTVAEAASKNYADMLSQHALGLVESSHDAAGGHGVMEKEKRGERSVAAFGLWGAASKQQLAAKKSGPFRSRFAVLGLMGTTLLELMASASAHPVLHMVGFK
jgi:ferrochelatase